LYRLADLQGDQGHRLPPRAAISVGRAPTNDIVLEDASVSARHAELRWEQGCWTVHDLGSTNGTFVSDRGILHEVRRVQRTALHPGSLVRFGLATYRLEHGQETVPMTGATGGRP
jgi:pSer/pThr/pTyr-binding forkhead associated (FHA) protein